MSKRHVVSVDDLKDFSFEHIIAACATKSLVLWAHPAAGHMHYKVTDKTAKPPRTMYLSTTIVDAIDAYNDLA